MAATESIIMIGSIMTAVIDMTITVAEIMITTMIIDNDHVSENSRKGTDLSK
jgi:hypothetical protein